MTRRSSKGRKEGVELRSVVCQEENTKGTRRDVCLENAFVSRRRCCVRHERFAEVDHIQGEQDRSCTGERKSERRTTRGDPACRQPLRRRMKGRCAWCVRYVLRRS